MLARAPLQVLQGYEQYTRSHGLPLWRLELQLARICMLLDGIRTGGATELHLQDYLIRADRAGQDGAATPPPQDQEVTPEEADAAAAALGFAPRTKRQPQTTPAQ